MRWISFALIGAVAAVLLGGQGRMPNAGPPPAAGQVRAARTPTNLTFFVAADLHLGVEGIEPLNRRMIEHMNDLPGKRYPGQVGGKVDAPLGVIVVGDLTDSGDRAQWDLYEKLYGRTGKEGLLKFPVFEFTGNHDRRGFLKLPVLAAVRKRHEGKLTYSWNWGNVHLVCLDLYPGGETIEWLKADLEAVGKRAPVVLFQHYPLSGPFADWWTEQEKEAFAKAIEGYNILGVFHGHFHGTGHYRWEGQDAYLVGSPRHTRRRFLAVRVTDNRMAVAAWDWDRGAWDWHHVKPADATAPPTSQPAAVGPTGQ